MSVWIMTVCVHVVGLAGYSNSSTRLWTMYGVSGGWLGDREKERNSESSKDREQELSADKEQERRQVRGEKGAKDEDMVWIQLEWV